MDLDVGAPTPSEIDEVGTVMQSVLQQQLASNDVSHVESVNADGVVETLACKQLAFPDAYAQHVARYGRRIKDSEDADLRLYTALSMFQSSSGDPQIAEQLQKITTEAELQDFFKQRNSEVENVHHMLDRQEKLALEQNKPLEDPLQKQTAKLLIKNAVDELTRLNMLEKAPDVSIAENTTEARVATIRRLQQQGAEIILVGASPDLRKALDLDDSADAKYREVKLQNEKSRAAVEAGLQTANTQNPADPEQAQALAQQIEGAAHIHRQATQNPNPIIRCDAVADVTSAQKKSDRWFQLKARDFANFLDRGGMNYRRLDTVAPIAPITADKFMSESVIDILKTEMFNMHVDALVHPSKLTLYLQGVSQPKMVLFSDQKIFLQSLLKFLGTTDMRPTEAQLAVHKKQQTERLKKTLEEQHIPAMINNEPVPDEHEGTHSKERISAIQRAVLGEAIQAFNQFLVDALSNLKPADEESTREFLRALSTAQRNFCVGALRSYELAIMLYYEEYIPVAARADLMTPIEEACEFCTPADMITAVLQRRKWFMTFREKTFLITDHEYESRWDLSKLCSVANSQDRVDPLRSWSPTYEEMLAFVRFLALKIGVKETTDVEDRAWRWAKKYVAEMRAANAN